MQEIQVEEGWFRDQRVGRLSEPLENSDQVSNSHSGPLLHISGFRCYIYVPCRVSLTWKVKLFFEIQNIVMSLKRTGYAQKSPGAWIQSFVGRFERMIMWGLSLRRWQVSHVWAGLVSDICPVGCLSALLRRVKKKTDNSPFVKVGLRPHSAVLKDIPGSMIRIDPWWCSRDQMGCCGWNQIANTAVACKVSAFLPMLSLLLWVLGGSLLLALCSEVVHSW